MQLVIVVYFMTKYNYFLHFHTKAVLELDTFKHMVLLLEYALAFKFLVPNNMEPGQMWPYI